MAGRRAAAERWDVLAVIAAGGAIGAVARYLLAVALPHQPGSFAVAIFVANVSGCLLIGALMAVITEAASPHRLLRPFLGVGVLGGFTTFSTYVIDVIDMASAGNVIAAMLYGGGTVVVALGAVLAGLVVTRVIVRPREGGAH